MSVSRQRAIPIRSARDTRYSLLGLIECFRDDDTPATSFETKGASIAIAGEVAGGNERLRREVERLRQKLKKQGQKPAEEQQRIADAGKQIAESERQLGLKQQNSTTSSKQPCSDGLAGKQRERCRRTKSKRKPAGPPGSAPAAGTGGKSQ